MARRKDAGKSDQAYRELIRVLEDALRAGADSVEMEYEDHNWIVYHNYGNTGLGGARIAKELEWDVINQIRERAGLSRKSKGKMQVSLLGKDCEVAVKTRESFGELVYHLTLKERQDKDAITVHKKKKKKNAVSKPAAPICWEFGPDIPTRDFFEERDLDELGDLEEAVDNFVYLVEGGTFLTWEAVVCEEQGLRLTSKQRKALGGLLDFNDEEDDGILYINDMPRYSEPWYIILNKIVPHLLIEPYRTFDCHEDVKCDGWNLIVTALREHGQGLSLPPGVVSSGEVVPGETRHKLWQQFCFNCLSGLGQEQELTLEDPKEHYRIDWFIEHLRMCKGSVAFFGLTLDSLLTRVVLPEKDRPIFLKQMQDKLGLGSAQEQIADRLQTGGLG